MYQVCDSSFMAQFVGTNEIQSLNIELSEIEKSDSTLSLGSDSSISSTTNTDLDEESILQWATIDRLPTVKRLRSSLFDENKDGIMNGKRVVDVTKLDSGERHMLIEKLIQHVQHDNLRLLRKMRKRIDNAGVKLPTIEVRYSNLQIEAACQVVSGKPLPTLWNSLKSLLLDIIPVPGLLSSKEAHINIIKNVSGVIKPGRMTLLLGPPGCGKTTLLKALSGNLDNSLKVSGEISYNGYKFDEFVPQESSAYISQNDLHMPELTVRETLDFAARCQSVGSRADIMAELTRKEKEANIIPDPDIDTYMKAVSVEGQKTTIQTDYLLKILGLDVCADTIYGDAMRRGISGGQKKRLTTGEMIVGPTKALFMDEISNGLDSSTAYQIICYLQQLAHITDATILVSLLQPAPETFDLFDDIILMGDGKIIYHGARNDVLEFFRSCGFKCPERKGVADFLLEVISKKDQEKYWQISELRYSYFSPDMFLRKYRESPYGKNLSAELSMPIDKSKSHKDAIGFSLKSVSKWTLFRACMSRELLLMKRNSFLYIFQSFQIIFIAFVSMTVFLRTQMGVDMVHANNYMGAIYFSLIIFLIDGFPELSMTVARLPVFYKQRDLGFYPAWASAIPASILKIPLSLLNAVIWTSLTYYVTGYSPEIGRFLRHMVLLFALHMATSSLYRFVACFFQNMIASTTAGNMVLLFIMLFSGFVIPKTRTPTLLKWAFWVSPQSYGEIGLSINEFLAPRWQQLYGNATIGQQILESRGLNYGGHVFWISVGALFGFTLLFNIGFTLALSFTNPSGSSVIISREKLSQLLGSKESDNNIDAGECNVISPPSSSANYCRERVVLPFQPLSIVFQDVQYYVETPMAMRKRGFNQEKLQLLCGITGAFRPGVLTALMGVSGAGKTTLLDVLAGRKTTGTVEGEIRVGGYPKVQSTFARISGYCEQTDIHSPQITEFVNDVLETIELDGIKDALVGLPGVDGLSTEQRKRLTIAVELVANPSMIFMDEPTTGLDARAAAIVMRAVKNVSSTGRTIVCTIHQPSIDIFEAFDELLLLKDGGQLVYCGPLGMHSCAVIEYFEAISGVPKIRDNYNPAAWVLEVTSSSSEAKLGINFAHIYKNSSLHEDNKEMVKILSTPPSRSKDLQFPTRYSQNSWVQFKSCLWKQYWSYWRSPSYNLNRSLFMLFTSFLVGFLFWGQGKKIHNELSLLTLLGSMYFAATFSGVNNSTSVLPYVSTERTVFYRERFCGMYASWAYSAAQVIIEIPYILAQALAFTVITYPMIGYYWSAYKVLWYFYVMFCTLLYYTYLGMMLVAITPSFPVAAVSQSTFYIMVNLFSGFLIPRTQIPKWWVWFYYMIPNSWSLNGMLTSQFGDVQKQIEVFGETKTVAAFLRDYFGFHHDMLPVVGVVLILYPIIFASLFAFGIGFLNFQKR